MYYVFCNSGEQESWEQHSVGFDTLKEAKAYKLEASQWDDYKHLEFRVMEEV